MMRLPVGTLTLRRPASLRDALRMLRDDGPLVPMAGCTDLYVAANAGATIGPALLDIWGLAELRGVAARGDGLRIGALTTYSDLLASKLVARRLPMLAASALEIGSVQVRNRGTVGGNVANASPAGDTLPVFAVAEATVVLASAGAERRVPFADFYTGYRATVRRLDELVVAIEVPPVEGTQWFRKVGTRAAQAVSKVVVAAVRAKRPRIAIGSVAPVVVRARRTEEVLAGGGSIADAQAAIQQDIHPIDDIRSTARYRRRVASNLLARFWADTA